MRTIQLIFARAGRTRMGLLGAIAMVAMAIAAPSSATAAGWPNGASVASFSGAQQADQVSSGPSLSADGNYLVFSSGATNLLAAAPNGGEFRRNLTTGTLELVAKRILQSNPEPGDPASPCIGISGRASISGDGRYVAFDTGESLVTADTNLNRDVYVRDMTKPITASKADDEYELISARDGSTTGATYSEFFSSDECMTAVAGSSLPNSSARAISNDGSKVLFTNTVASDLPAAAGSTVGRGQLFVRDRSANPGVTTLVTKQLNGNPLPGPDAPLYFYSTPKGSISGDGTTVGWAGENARLQTPFQASENADDGGTLAFMYLVRRIADGPSAGTRRLSGIADVEAPGCDMSSVSIDFDNTDNSNGAAPTPCQGPFMSNEEGAQCATAPSLADDGYKVAFTSCLEPRAYDPLGGGITNRADVFVTNLSPGVLLKSGVREITHSNDPGVSSEVATSPTVNSVRLTGDGKRIAFTTQRSQFPATSMPFPVQTTPATTGALPSTFTSSHVFVVDAGCSAGVADDTIEWASRSTNGTVLTVSGSPGADGTASEIALDGDGDTLAFATDATNAFAGDANGRKDVVYEKRTPNDCTPPVTGGGGGGGGGGGAGGGGGGGSAVVTALDVSSPKALPNGTATVSIKVSGAGSVKAVLSAKLPKGKKKKLAVLPAGAGSASPGAAGTSTITMKLNAAAKKQLKAKGKLSVSAKITFTDAAGKSVTKTVTLSFKAKKKK